MDIDTHLRGRAICGAPGERLKAQPARDRARVFHGPERMPVRRMLMKPRQPFFDGHGRELSAGHSRLDGRVKDSDDRRKVRFSRVADDHAARTAASGAGAVWKKICSKVG